MFNLDCDDNLVPVGSIDGFQDLHLNTEIIAFGIW